MQEDLFVGTAGTSVWFGRDRGETWTRPYSESGLYIEARVWALSIHADMPGVVFAGTDHGIFRGDPQRQKWQHLPSPLDTHSTTLALSRRVEEVVGGSEGNDKEPAAERTA